MRIQGNTGGYREYRSTQEDTGGYRRIHEDTWGYREYRRIQGIQEVQEVS